MAFDQRPHEYYHPQVRAGAIRLISGGIVLAGGITVSAQPPRYVERVDVTRVLVDVRALGRDGHPLPALVAANFDVKLDGIRARVDSLQWIGGAAHTADDTAHGDAETSHEARGGRLIVLLFQKDLEPTRIVGLMRMLIDWQPFLDGFTPLDRVAVLSYDSHLKMWTDFTSDLARVKQVLHHGILFESAPARVERASPSLIAEGLTPEKARTTYSIERALMALGDALKPLPGAKSLVLIGHGFGRLGRGGVMMEGDYDAARDALVAARASVFSLDVTQADYHSLEAGLQLVSEETGGFYASTYHFPEIALDRLTGVLAGHYVLFVDAPRLKPGSHRLTVDLKGVKGEILAPAEVVTSSP